MTDLYTNGSRHQTHAMNIFMKGMDEPSEVRYYDRALAKKPNSDTCVIWGTRNKGLMEKLYKNIVVLEAGYFNTGPTRLDFYSVGLNGLNGRAEFNNVDSPSDRWEKYGPEIPSWKSSGDYYLIMGQVPGDMAVKDVDLYVWYTHIYEELSMKTDIPVFFRAHPNHPYPANNIKPLIGPLDEALYAAKGVITYNSNTGVDAVLSGTPAMSQDVGSMAWDVTAHSVNDLLGFHYPSIKQWAYDLAYTQWTPEELINGSAWRHINATN